MPLPLPLLQIKTMSVLRKTIWSMLAGLITIFILGFVLWLVCAPRPPLLEGISFSPVILDRDGGLLRMGLSQDEKYRVRIQKHDVSSDMLRAVFLYEDRYFYHHPGINPLSMARACADMLGGARRMGGSTITMQVARLRLGLRTDTIPGKIRQILKAIQYEYHYSKDEILAAYFALVPYGGNIEGVGAAARVYFHTTPGRLTRSESMALAVIPQDPVARSPLNGKELDAARMRMASMISESEANHDGKNALHTSLPPLRVHTPARLPFEAPHLSSELLALGKDEVKTFIDLRLQHSIEKSLQAFAARGRRYDLDNAAALLIHWPTMEVRALVGSADFHNAKISGQIDGTRARRSPGSTLKPFIYAMALDQGLIHPQTVLADSPRSFGGYDPENFDRTFQGPLPAHEALRTSRNLPAILLASKLRPDLYSFLKRSQVQLPFSSEHYGLSLVLGGAEVSMRDLGTLYAMLANKGIWRPLHLYEGEKLAPAVSLLSPEAALVTLHMLEEKSLVLRTAQGVIPLRCKTGTSNGFRDAWTAGVVGQYVLIVWVGHFDNHSNPLLVGGNVALPLFSDIARSLAESSREPLRDLLPGQQKGLNIIREKVCTSTGDLDISLCEDVTETWYIPGRSPTRPSGIFRKILIDTETGLRLCLPHPGRTEEKIWEFWPSDLSALFLQAGVVKPPPPPLDPSCTDKAPAGTPPRILSPKEGVVYQRQTDPLQENAIPLIASADADAHALFWFIRGRFLGRSLPGQTLLWFPEDGDHVLRVVDDLGRSSSQRLKICTIQ